MFKYIKLFEPIMNKLLVYIIIAVVGLGMIGTTTMMELLDSYATKTLKQSQQPSEAPGATTVPPERRSQQPSEAPGATVVRPDRQSQFSPEQQEEEDGINAYIVWFNDQNTPNNNSEVLFRSSTSGGITFTDKINLSNTTSVDSINAEIAADGNNVIITWWERNATSIKPVVRVSSDSGAIFGPLLRLTTNGTIGG
jgi:hypothetical protein